MTFAATLMVASACSAQCGPTATNPNPTPVAATPTHPATAIPTSPLAATSAPFHGGEAGLAYAPVALSATGGRAPYKWSVSSGALPDGLTLGGDGKVSGTPTTGGTFSFTIQVNDSGDSTASLPGTISIADQLAASLVSSCADYCRVELGCDSTCGGFGHLAGGVGPYSFSQTQGQLPAGTSLHGFSLLGTFGGASGWLQFTVQASDSLGATAAISPKFWMYDHISLTSGKCFSSFYATTPCTASLPYSGGVPGIGLTVSVVSASGQICTRQVTGAITCSQTGSPPPGFTATVGGGAVNTNVPASPNFYFTYSGVVTLGLTDTDPCSAGAKCSTTATEQIDIGAG